MSQPTATPTSSWTSVCCQCQEAKERLGYIIPVPGGKKEFCSESCLTQHRRQQKAAAAAPAPAAAESVDTTSGNSEERGEASGKETEQQSLAEKSSDASTSGDKAETSKNDAPLSPRKSSSSSDSDTSFSWKDYLKESNSTAAPPSCFKQAPDPPDNEFVLGAKLEAQDPRSQMACIASVIAVQVIVPQKVASEDDPKVRNHGEGPY